MKLTCEHRDTVGQKAHQRELKKHRPKYCAHPLKDGQLVEYQTRGQKHEKDK